MSTESFSSPDHPGVPGLNYWKRVFGKDAKLVGQDMSDLTWDQKFQLWMMQGGMNRLLSENCMVKGIIGLIGGGTLGFGFGAFLAPFDGRTGMRVS